MRFCNDADMEAEFECASALRLQLVQKSPADAMFHANSHGDSHASKLLLLLV